MQTAILGWGSLLWDRRSNFEEQHGDWQLDGPNLKLEFSRISQTRNGALTLVLDYSNGIPCQVAYALSKRKSPNDAICDLRSREGTTLRNIGFYFADESLKNYYEEAFNNIHKEAFNNIKNWATERKIDVVIWTNLQSNFQKKTGKTFSIDTALAYLQSLNTDGKVKAAEYILRAPKFINTPLQKALQTQSWFTKQNFGENKDV